MGHRFGHDNIHMDNACFKADAMLAEFLPLWLADGYEVIVTADHGQSERGHHGGHEDVQQEFALYYFGKGKAVATKQEDCLDQLQLTPTILSRLGVAIPGTMVAKSFLK